MSRCFGSVSSPPPRRRRVRAGLPASFYRRGEERVQKGVAQARIAPPRRVLAQFSPLPQRGVIRRVKLPAGQKLVALTFDLCEQASEIAGYQGGNR